jgi:beta-galactosidase
MQLRPATVTFAVSCLALVGCLSAIFAVDAASAARVCQSIDTDWSFHKGESPGAELADFDDSNWQFVDLPHDWSIAGPFDKDHPTGGAGGFLPAGVGWYRKELTLPATQAGQRVAIEFDGVMANSDVWINGQHLGRRPNGYVSFQYDLTDSVTFGDDQPNVLAVRVDNSGQPASRWYTGAGIYRHVRLVITDTLRVAPWGVFVTTPEVSIERAVVRVVTDIANDFDAPRRFTLETRLLDSAGQVAAVAESHEEIDPRTVRKFQQELVVDDPQLWNLDDPQLYRAETRIDVADELVDDVATPFGIRTAEFKSDTGFWLNGRNVKIYGVCLHHDGGALGAAVPSAAWERRLRRLQLLGINAVRTAHNPAAPELLDLCDRLGILVMDEFFDCWTLGKEPFDYHLYFDDWAHVDVRDTIRRDRNHPSVILYSVGNEIRDTPKEELAKRVLAGLVEVCHETDPTRPVTQALFRPNVSGDYDNGLADMLDVIGTNYRDRELLAAWRDNPQRKIIGTEQRHDRETWLACRDYPQHAGQFLWCGVDYLGESRRWPVTTFNGGLLDRTGAPQVRAFERQSWWSDDPMVYAVRRVAPDETAPADPGYEAAEWQRREALFPDWTPVAPRSEDIEVFSNCDEVELVVNGRSLGTKPLPADARPRRWKVEFEPGTLVAIGRNGGTDVARHELHTAGPPARVQLAVERDELAPDWDDVAYVEAEVVDAAGVRVPRADDLITFTVTGPAEIVAVDNGSITSHEPFQTNERRAHQGRCIAILRATGGAGAITVTATAAGLEPGTVRLSASGK